MPPLIIMVLTLSSVFGFQLVAAPFTVLTAAM